MGKDWSTLASGQHGAWHGVFYASGSFVMGMTWEFLNTGRRFQHSVIRKASPPETVEDTHTQSEGTGEG